MEISVIRYPEKKDWEKILVRPVIDFESLLNTVRGIIYEVKSRGDQAVREYTEKFDKVLLSDFRVSEEEIKEAGSHVKEELKKALKTSLHNIRLFHEAQKYEIPPANTSPGVRCWQKNVPIEKVGLYIPGGTAPLISTVLMLGVPAKLAGCKEIIICSPPDPGGKIHPAIIYTANLLGIKKIFKIGGAQAIAAMAYGTETVPKVYKIFGPGNQYVTAAKMAVNVESTAIDMPAGPSEVAIIADDSAIPEYVASDLLSQAEHGKDSQVILISTSENVFSEVTKELSSQLENLPRRSIAEDALKNTKFILMKDDITMIDLINEYAPEHLIIATSNSNYLADKIINAGSVFLGNFSPESAGDYASGTNHVLPTNGYAKAYSGLNLDNFMKKISFQELTKYGLFNIGPSIEILADAEDLHGHKRAIQVRLKSVSNNYNNGKS